MASCIAAHMLSTSFVGLNISERVSYNLCPYHYMRRTWKVDTVMGRKMLGILVCGWSWGGCLKHVLCMNTIQIEKIISSRCGYVKSYQVWWLFIEVLPGCCFKHCHLPARCFHFHCGDQPRSYGVQALNCDDEGCRRDSAIILHVCLNKIGRFKEMVQNIGHSLS